MIVFVLLFIVGCKVVINYKDVNHKKGSLLLVILNLIYGVYSYLFSPIGLPINLNTLILAYVIVSVVNYFTYLIIFNVLTKFINNDVVFIIMFIIFYFILSFAFRVLLKYMSLSM